MTLTQEAIMFSDIIYLDTDFDDFLLERPRMVTTHPLPSRRRGEEWMF